MDEAEQLCDKIAIMVNGKIQCYGSPSELKQCHNQAYSIKICKLVDDEKWEKDAGMASFRGSLEEVTRSKIGDNETINYSINRNAIQEFDGLPGIFEQLEKGKKQNLFTDYGVSRPSLE